jgi:DNA-directed RNA polymerase subunit RPC12/RpoP
VAREALNPKCPQCGGPVDVPEGATYARCKYCSAESFVDLRGAILHQILRHTVARSRVPGLIKASAREAGWAEVTITDLDLFYEPIWEIESPDGRRLRISARPGPQGRFAHVQLPGGERAFVEAGQRDSSAEWKEPELAPESVAEVAARATGRPVAVKTLRLVHRPMYEGALRIGQEKHEVQVDAVTGELIDVDWPARPSYRFRNQAWRATAIMVLAAALLPLPLAALAVLVVGGYTALVHSRQSTAPKPVG